MQTFIEMVKNKTGLEKTKIDSIWSVYDTLFCEVSFTCRLCAHILITRVCESLQTSFMACG